MREKDQLQLRLAAFNVINRANYTFTNLYPGGYSLNFSGTQTGLDLNQDLASTANSNTNFGSAPLRTGRRVAEISVKYVF